MKKIYYAYADFETTYVELPQIYKNYKDYYENDPAPKMPAVYSWNVLYNHDYEITNAKPFIFDNDIDKTKSHYGISGNSFLQFINTLKKDVVMYFNNLKKFDGHFIIPILDKAKYVNVLPFDIEKYLDLDDETKINYDKRVIKIKDKILSVNKNKEMFNSLMKDWDFDIDKVNRKFLIPKIKRVWNRLFPNEYSVLTNGDNQIYEIKIGLGSQKKTGDKISNRALIIRDNLLLFPTSIKAMGVAIYNDYLNKNELKNNDETKNFFKDKFFKKELQGGYLKTEKYNKIDELENDGNQLLYLIQDTYILWKFHNLIEVYFPRKKWKLTIGATSYNLWIENFGEELTKHYLKNGAKEVVLKRGAKRVAYKKRIYSTMNFKKKILKDVLPVSWLDGYNKTEKMYNEIYKWYGGGITFVNEKFRGEFTENLTFIDINSSYPAQQVKDINVPYGNPQIGDNKDYPFKFYKLTPKKTIYNKTGLPFLFNELSSKREYLSTLKKNQIFRFTSLSYNNFLKFYKADKEDYTLKVEYCFKQIPISTFFKSFVEKWYDIKETAAENNDVILKMIAKLFMNNVYGKLGTKIVRDSKIWNQHKSNWEKYTKFLNAEYYLPLAVAITELARMDLVNAVDNNYENCLYGDTDSLCFQNFKKWDHNIELHKSKIGCWGIDFDDGYGVFRRAKQYMLLNESSYKLAYAGINFNRFILPDNELNDLTVVEKEYKKITLLDFMQGKKINNQLTPYRLLGDGLILTDTIKEIKPVWDYLPLTEQTRFTKQHFSKSINKIKHFEKNNKISI